MRTIVWKYGLRPPVEGGERVLQQMRAAHMYRNQLIEAEHVRRSALRKVDTAAGVDLFAAIGEKRRHLDELLAEIKRHRSSTRKRSEDPALRQRAKEARADLKSAISNWREQMKAARPSAQDDRDRINAEFAAKRRELRPGLSKGPDGVVAGSYQLVEDSVGQSSKMPLWDSSLNPSDPRFVRWNGDGFVSQQFPGGVSAKDLMEGGSNHVAITAPEYEARDDRDPNSRRSMLRKRVQLWLRVGSVGRSPVWAKWPMVMHRPLPDGAQVQRATVRVRHVGPRPEWTVEFVLRVPDVIPKSGPAVAIDVGWRQKSDGSLRLAVACDSDGATQEFILPNRIRSGLSLPNELRATRDLNMNEARGRLSAWLSDKASEPIVPNWLRDATSTLHAWRSPARLASLAIKWRVARFHGDDDAFDDLESWRKQDRHLWLWETSQRTGALRARKDWFRCVSAELARRYATLVLEKFDLRQVAEIKPADQDEADNQTSRTNRVVAAIGELREVLRNAFTQRGGTVVEVDAQNTTRACSTCGAVELFDAAAMLRHRCVNGHEWDQDENAARNIIDRWRGRAMGETDRSLGEAKESRRERVARMQRERADRMGRSKADAVALMPSNGV